MSEINLTGTPGNAMSESYLKISTKDKTIDAVILPKTSLSVGDKIYWQVAKDTKLPILKTVTELIDRRPSKGDWSNSPVHKDWVSFKYSD